MCANSTRSWRFDHRDCCGCPAWVPVDQVARVRHSLRAPVPGCECKLYAVVVTGVGLAAFEDRFVGYVLAARWMIARQFAIEDRGYRASSVSVTPVDIWAERVARPGDLPRV